MDETKSDHVVMVAEDNAVIGMMLVDEKAANRSQRRSIESVVATGRAR